MTADGAKPAGWLADTCADTNARCTLIGAAVLKDALKPLVLSPPRHVRARSWRIRDSLLPVARAVYSSMYTCNHASDACAFPRAPTSAVTGTHAHAHDDTPF